MNIAKPRYVFHDKEGQIPPFRLTRKRAFDQVNDGDDNSENSNANHAPPGNPELAGGASGYDFLPARFLAGATRTSPKKRSCCGRVSKTKANEGGGLKSYGPNDVLSGRGGGTNQHEGNRYFRALISENREKYLRAKKNDKPFISLSIVSTIRERNGRFLRKVENSGLWFEVGDAAAREKTSQALRQRAPEYRKQLFQEEINKPLQDRPVSAPVARSLTTCSKTPNDLLLDINSVPMWRNDRNVAPIVRKLPSSHTHQNRSNTTIINNSVASSAAAAALDLFSVTLRRAQLQEEAQKTLRLQQKLHAIKVLELALLKSSPSYSSYRNNFV